MIDSNHPVTKLANLRDLGGAPSAFGTMKHELVYRSDDVATIDNDQFQELLALKLGLVIDFRSKAEAEAVGRGPLAGEQVDYLHLPLLDFIGEDHNLGQEQLKQEFTNDMLGTWYAQVLQKAAPMIVDGISAIAEHEGTALFHCAIGKDRTGIFASALYSLLEVEQSHIIKDFHQTDKNLPKILARLQHSQPFWNEQTMRATGALMRAEPQAMETMLRVVSESARSVEQILEDAGLTNETKQRLIAKHF